jgi:hypothetical protein
MADIDVVRKEPAGESSRSLTWLWAVIAILAVGGLMAWLAVQSDRITTAAVVQEDDDRRAAPAAAQPGDAEPAELGAVAAAPEPFVGRRVSVDNVEVAANLGPSAFWGDVPGANPFLVMFSPNLTERPELAAGQTYSLQGVINVVTDSAINAWVETGAIRAGARDEASFATHYLLAEQIVR